MSIIKNTIPVALIIAIASIASPIGAQPIDIPTRGPIPFEAYDRDGNGFVSEQEFNTVRGERMAAKAAEGRPMHGAASAPSFSAFDSNGDGQLTQSELAAGQKAQMEKRRGMGRGMGQGMGQGQGMGKGRNMPVYSDFDLDGNGLIVENEFIEARNKRIGDRAKQGYQMRNLSNMPSFTDIDTNGDGAISEDEFNTHQSQHRQQRAQ